MHKKEIIKNKVNTYRIKQDMLAKNIEECDQNQFGKSKDQSEINIISLRNNTVESLTRQTLANKPLERSLGQYKYILSKFNLDRPQRNVPSHAQLLSKRRSISNVTFLLEQNDENSMIGQPTWKPTNSTNRSRAQSLLISDKPNQTKAIIELTPEQLSIRIDRACQILFPISFLMYNIIYWSIIYCKLQKQNNS